MGLNLYRYMRLEGFTGIKKDFLRHLSTSILTSLAYVKKAGIIHCDLKPENILFTDNKNQNVKIIDFGSSCFNYRNGYTYV